MPLKTPGGDPAYDYTWLRVIVLALLLPANLAIKVFQALFDWCFPPTLRWQWDTAANPGRAHLILYTYNDSIGRRIDTSKLSFPEGFLWGTATAAHQIEGTVLDAVSTPGGCTNNNWAKWENSKDPDTGKPRIWHGQKSGKAADHWNRVKEDVQLMKVRHI
jgi:hypothetical protein